MTTGWQKKPLADLVENLDSRRVPVKEVARRRGPFPYYGASGIVDYVDGFLFEGLHLLVAEDGENLRTRKLPVAFLANGRFWVNNHAHVLRGNENADTRFLCYALQHADISAFLSGSTMPKLTQGNLLRIPILTPSLADQRAIASTLGALDDKIELNRQMNETLEAMARALFRDWFVDFGPTRAKMEGRDPYLAPDLWSLFPDRLDAEGKPEGWAVQTLVSFFEILGGGTPKTTNEAFWGSDIPWFSVVDTPSKGSVFVIDTEKSITSLGLANSSARMVPKGTTIITARGTVGNLAVAGRDMTFNQSCYGLRGISGVGPNSVYLIAQNMISRLQAMAHGSVFSTITRQTFESLCLTKPSPSVLEAFEMTIAPLFDRILANVSENRTLAETRDLLLPRLMSGELRISDLDSDNHTSAA